MRRMMFGRRSRESGQSMLVIVFISLLLFVTIPSMVFMNQINNQHQVDAGKKAQAFAVARAGITYAKSILSPVWPQALAAPNPAQLYNVPGLSDCQGTTPIQGPDGSFFRITCDRVFGGIQPYQVHVIATALEPAPGPTYNPVRSLEALVSAQTLAVNLPEDVHASLALEMVNAPTLSQIGPIPTLDVEWGPLACFDTANPLNIPPASFAISNEHYPRKFSIRGYNVPGTTPPPGIPTTDDKEYWSFASLGFTPPLNDEQTTTASDYGAGYTGMASNSACSITGSAITGSTLTNPLTGGGSPSCYFNGGGNAVTFDSTNNNGGNLTFGGPHQVIYVTNAGTASSGAGVTLQNSVDLDLFQATATEGALVIDGDLTLGASVGGFGGPINFPPLASQEYYGYTGTIPWPCKGTTTPTCSPPGLSSQFRGFLWVKGNLIVNGNWTINGVVLVGNPGNPSAATPQLTTANNSNLTIYYDDQINRGIHVGAVQLQSDMVREITPR